MHANVQDVFFVPPGTIVAHNNNKLLHRDIPHQSRTTSGLWA